MVAMRPIKSVGDIPTLNHWAVIVFRHHTIHHEGDERSRTHPGHGYPAHDETLDLIQYYPCATLEIARDFIENLYREKIGREDVALLAVTPKALSPQIVVNIS